MTNAISFASHIADYTKIAQNLILSLCGISTVVIAYFGLTTWRKELKGKSEYAKAKEVLKAVYKVHRGFMVVRAPAIFSYEYPDEMLDESGNLKDEYSYKGLLHVYEQRWKFLSEAFRELEDQTLEARVEWGNEFQEVIVPLRKCLGELQTAVQNLLRARQYPQGRGSLFFEERANESSILYYVGENSKHDKFTPQINAAIRHFEAKLRPHIRK